MPGWMKHKLESRFLGEIAITSDMQMTPTLWQKTKNWRASDESERGEWKWWLKTQHSKNEDHGIQSHHLMANWWGISGNCDRLYFLGLKKHCSHEIKRCLLLGRKVMTNFSSVQSLSRVQLFATPWIAARQASPSITNSRSSLRLTSIESVFSSYVDFKFHFS